MEKFINMVLWSSVRLGVPLLASVVVFQTGCLYLTVFADLHLDSSQRPFQINQPVVSFKSGESSHEKVERGKHGIFIHDFSSMGSSQVVMEVKEMDEDGDVHETESEVDYDIVEESSLNRFTTDDLKQLENRFLNLFGMKKRPAERQSSGNKRAIPKEVIELYEKQTSSGYPTTDLFLPGKLTRNANTVRTFGPIGNSRSTGPEQSIFNFDLTSIPKNEIVMGAELRVPFSISINSPTNSNLEEPSTSPTFIRVLAHDIVKPQKVSKSKNAYKTIEPITYATDSKLVNLTNRKRSTFWLTFDVFPAISRWMASANHTKSNHGISIQMMGLNGEPYEKIDEAIKFNMKVKSDAILFTYSDDGHNAKRRSKRDAKTISRKYRNAQQHHYQHQARRRRPHKHKNRRRNLCSKKPMFVDFTDVGWNDWIVAPPGYQAFFCSGECPFPMAEHLNATNHAVIQALINSMNPALVPPPCCVPNKYSSLSLLYTDSSDRIVLKNYNEMVVDSCGCN
ncbi:unnamed protein product [Orchesella dallaii]|uniref:TGF-beta family profile domain-containing protein n=1 Tax=Orchesella dallaii TaxID=48710 RepID=A0ABP1PSZ9_9HEXA